MNVLIIGKQGMLAQELQQAFSMSGFHTFCKGRSEIDLCRSESIREVIQQVQPSLIVNAAAYTAVDQAESEPDQAFATNRDGVNCLAQHASRLDLPVIHVSTDYVFDGNSRRPYREDDPTSPLGVYGLSKWEGEQALRSVHSRHIILRTAWVYSMYGRNFLKTIVTKAQEGQELRIVDDQRGCPTWAKDLASVIVAITQQIHKDKEVPWGTYHFCGSGETTWFEFAQAIIKHAQEISPFQAQPIIPISTDGYPTVVQRPAYSVLDCSEISKNFNVHPPSWQDSMPQCVKELFACPDLLHARS